MKALDRFLQQWRVRKALPHVRAGDRLLDVGCFDRTLLDRAADRTADAVGVDLLAEPSEGAGVRVLRGVFPQDFDFADAQFDCITALAVFEHVEDPGGFAAACHRLLSPGGRVVLTVPHPFVDRILDVLLAVGIADGMSAEEHHGFDVNETPGIFAGAGFEHAGTETFQLGLNRLFVFRKPAAA